MQRFEVLAKQAFSSEKMKKVGLFDTANLFCDLYCLRPGQSQKPHTHQGADKIYFVLQGRGTFLVGEEEKVLDAGEIVLAPSGAVHGVANHTPQPLNLLVVMAPNPNRQRGGSRNTSG